MTHLKAITLTLAIFTAAASAHAHCAACGTGDHSHGAVAKKNIVETAVSAGSFETLVAAIKVADLVETLSSAGPFTVFAPTDAAFAKLPEGTLESLLLPENKEKLVGILTYHVVPGKVMAAQVKSGPVATVNGQFVDLKASYGSVKVGGAKVVQTDIATSNGVIHVIDSVILPPETVAAK